MLGSSHTSHTTDERRQLLRMLEQYAARYYLTGPEKSALVSATITEFAENPDLLLNQPVEKAIASTMDRLYRVDVERRVKSRN